MSTRREFLHRAGALGAAGVVAGSVQAAGGGFAPHLANASGATKTASTLYPPAKVAAARQNIAAGLPWAVALRDEAVAAADAFLARGEDTAWSSVTGQLLPRSYAVNQALGSPITGTQINEHGAYPWLIDVANHPWKLVDPSVPEGSDQPRVYPTNDFAAFYATALDEHGVFDPERGDRSLLVNELYPELGPDWGVDDGYGWVDGDGAIWTFIAYYNHWGLWVALASSPAGYGGNQRALESLRDAYLYTGDAKYARTGLILLDRIADVYPDMDVLPYGPADGFQNGSGGNGKAVSKIWEALRTTQTWISAYDAFFPEIATADSAGVVAFLSQKATEFDIGPKDVPQDIRANIEDNILRQIYPNVQIAKIHGNFGMHQTALAMAAVVLDDPVESPEWIDFVFASGTESTIGPPSDWSVTGGNIGPKLIDVVDRDGAPDEVAPGYNRIWIQQVGEVANVLAGYERYPAADLYEHPKFARMIANHPDLALTMVNRYLPSIGDSGKTGMPWPEEHATAAYISYFERYGDPAFAQLAHLLNGNTTDGLRGDIFSAEATDTVERVAQIIDELGALALPSINHTGFGFAALRAGTGSGMRGVWTYYGRIGTGIIDRPGGPIPGHGHRDALNIGIYAFDLDLAPDLGYVSRTGSNPRRMEWESHTISHNTVMVNQQRHALHWGGTPHGFLATEDVQYSDISAPDVYPDVNLYRRSTVQIAIDSHTSYLVDVFRVAGGSEHHFSFHGPEGSVATSGLDLVEQSTGTYAGPDIEQPAEDARVKPDPSGLDWLNRVERATDPAAEFSVDWDVVDTWDVHGGDGPDVHLRLTMLNEVDDVALCDGTPPTTQVGSPDALRYLIAHRGKEIRVLDSSGDAVEFGDAWRDYSSALTVGGTYAISMPNTPQTTVTIRWTGGRAQVIGSTGHAGQVHGLARITIDGQDHGVASWSRPEAQLWQQVIHDTGELPDGDHVMVITALGEKGEHAGQNDVGIRISFDALKVIPPELNTQFVSVIEPYEATSKIRSMSAVPARPRGGATVAEHEVAAVRVELVDGRVDHIVHSLRPEVTFDIDGLFLFQGSLGVVSRRRGRPVRAVCHDTTQITPVAGLRPSAPAVLGQVSDFTRELSHTNVLAMAVGPETIDPDAVVGDYVYVTNDGERNAVYRIEAARLSGEDLILELGNQTFIRGYVDPTDPDAGYHYDIAIGAAARIPLTRQWSA